MRPVRWDCCSRGASSRPFSSHPCTRSEHPPRRRARPSGTRRPRRRRRASSPARGPWAPDTRPASGASRSGSSDSSTRRSAGGAQARRLRAARRAGRARRRALPARRAARRRRAWAPPAERRVDESELPLLLAPLAGRVSGAQGPRAGEEARLRRLGRRVPDGRARRRGGCSLRVHGCEEKGRDEAPLLQQSQRTGRIIVMLNRLNLTSANSERTTSQAQPLRLRLEICHVDPKSPNWTRRTRWR